VPLTWSRAIRYQLWLCHFSSRSWPDASEIHQLCRHTVSRSSRSWWRPSPTGSSRLFASRCSPSASSRSPCFPCASSGYLPVSTSSTAQALLSHGTSALIEPLVLSARNARCGPSEGFRRQLPGLPGVSPRRPEAQNRERDG